MWQARHSETYMSFVTKLGESNKKLLSRLYIPFQFINSSLSLSLTFSIFLSLFSLSHTFSSLSLTLSPLSLSLSLSLSLTPKLEVHLPLLLIATSRDNLIR